MRDARIELDFADGQYSFRLPWGGLVELQEKCAIGPYALLNRLNSDDWRVEDISEVIRIGLIGGANGDEMHPVKANKLVERYVKARPPTENLNIARGIMLVALFGAPEEEAAKTANKGDEIETTDGLLKTKDIYGAGAVMGFTPQDINAMTVFQFMAAFDGYVKHHSPDDGKLSPDEFNDLSAFLDTVKEG